MPPLNHEIALPPLGAHVSIAGGFGRAIERARSIGAAAFQLFVKNSNQWQGPSLSLDEAKRFREQSGQLGFAPPVAHGSYLINLASMDPAIARRSMYGMVDELERARLLGIAGMVIHPGAHKGLGEAEGLRLVAERINQIMERLVDHPVPILLETTAGQGTCLGHRFEHLAEIIRNIEHKSRIGVCLDTCHVFAAGYEMRTPAGVQATLQAFDETIGLKWLRVIHVNDSKTPLGSRRDRHEHIGQGEIGEAGFAALLRDRRLGRLPFILETPKGEDLEEDRMNLATLRRLAMADRELPPA